MLGFLHDLGRILLVRQRRKALIAPVSLQRLLLIDLFNLLRHHLHLALYLQALEFELVNAQPAPDQFHSNERLDFSFRLLDSCRRFNS